MSASTRSLPRAAARWTASNTTALGSPPSAPRTISVPVRSAHMASWSAAAARKVSPAASRTERPAADWRRASLPMVVVLPTPLTPTMSQTSGAPGRAVEAQRPGARCLEQLADGRAERGQQVVAAADLLGLDLGPQVGEQGVGGGDADVGPDECLLERVPGGRVDPARPQRGDCAAEQAAHAAQAAAVGRRRRRSSDGRVGRRGRGLRLRWSPRRSVVALGAVGGAGCGGGGAGGAGRCDACPGPSAAGRGWRRPSPRPPPGRPPR